MKSTLNTGKPEELERKHALEFLALSPTEKYRAIMNLIQVNYEIRAEGAKIPDRFNSNNK